MLKRTFAVLLAGFAFALVSTAPASATTFCVPGYHAACPNANGNVASASLEFALTSNGMDGVPDKVIVDNFTWTDPDTLQPNGTDPLEIVGAGTAQTVITSSSTGNIYVMTSGFGERVMTIKNLTIRVPASIASGGDGLYIEQGHLENVDIETRHPASAFGINVSGGVTYKGGRIYGSAGGYFANGAITSDLQPGAFNLDGVTIDGSKVGLVAQSPKEPFSFTNGHLLNSVDYAAQIYGGGQADFENSVVEGGGQGTFYMLSDSSTDSHLNIESSTAVAGDPTKPAISGSVPLIANYGTLRVNVKNSILRGYDSTYNLTAPTNQGSVGNTHISFTDSNFNLFGSRTGDGSTYMPASNINQDPKFSPSGDYSLTEGSPSIDAGDPFAIEPAKDIFGHARPIDGNNDGVAIRDQGAYEFVPDVKGPPPSCATDPALCPVPPDKTKPKITKVKFRHGRSPKKGGYLKLKLSEAAKVKAIFKPKPKGKGRKKRKTVKLVKQSNAGTQKLNIRKKRLKPGKYKLTITATDAAGNRSRTVKRTVKVRSSRS